MVAGLRGIRRQNPKHVKTTRCRVGEEEMLSRDCQVLTYTTEWIMIKKHILSNSILQNLPFSPGPITPVPKRNEPNLFKAGSCPQRHFLRLQSFRKHKKTFM